MPTTRFAFLPAAALALGALLSVGASGASRVFGSVNIPAGSTATEAETVNGSVNIGDGANVGSAKTVNGAIHIGDNVTVESIETVNGRIQVGAHTRVTRNVAVVNGAVRIGRGADVGGDVSTVNGRIDLDEAHVAGKLITVNGGLDIGAGSRVDGGIHVQKPSRHSDDPRRYPTVVIGPGAIVGGKLVFDRPVNLYVSETAKIGPVEGVVAKRFTGDRPDFRQDRRDRRDRDDGHEDEEWL